MRPPARSTRSARSLPGGAETTRQTEAAVRPARGAPRRPSTRENSVASDKDKKPRHRMSNTQLERLEALYQQATHPTREEKLALGNEVGMDIRTVTVWFQNRRQLSKKQSSNSSSRGRASVTPFVSRPPLATVTHRNGQDPSRHPSTVVSSLFASNPRSHSQDICPCPHEEIQPHELWEHLPSSPRTSSTRSSTRTSGLTTPLLGPDHRQPASDTVHDITGGKRKLMLEWACARLEKRSRVHISTNDTNGSGDTTEDDLETMIVDIDDCSDEGDKGQPPPGLAARTSFSIPPEYTVNFSPDVVLGASLLLTFKHSAAF